MALHIKRSGLALFCCSCVLILAACSTNQVPTPEIEAVDQSNLPWSIELNNWEVANDLSGSQAAMQYNGDVAQVQYNEKPSDGNTFLLIELTIKKQIAGSSTFKWEYLSVKDSSGNRYTRLSNDTFLENYNFPRLKSTDLTFGENKGFICFEIPQAAADETLTLEYESPDETVELPIK